MNWGIDKRMSTKEDIRKSIIYKRSLLTPTEVEEKSFCIFKQLLEMPSFQKAKVVLCYSDFKNEVKTQMIIDHCIKGGKIAALPRMEISEGIKVIVPYAICRPEDELKNNKMGIMEPMPELCSMIHPQEIDIVIVPGVAFDMRGFRVGYGGGYYDRFLPGIRQDCLKIGVCFEVQMVQSVPNELYDIQLDAILTEDRKINIERILL